MTIPDQIPSVNYHLWKPCNMRCVFCFATFQDIGTAMLPKGHLGRDGSLGCGRVPLTGRFQEAELRRRGADIVTLASSISSGGQRTWG